LPTTTTTDANSGIPTTTLDLGGAVPTTTTTQPEAPTTSLDLSGGAGGATSTTVGTGIPQTGSSARDGLAVAVCVLVAGSAFVAVTRRREAQA
jgi:LPXTG-motif cell wall-anchored protein